MRSPRNGSIELCVNLTQMIGLDDALWRSEEWLGEHDDRGLDRSMALLEREKLGFR